MTVYKTTPASLAEARANTTCRIDNCWDVHSFHGSAYFAVGEVELLRVAVEAGKNLSDVAAKAVFEDGYEERLLIENWPLMDALTQFREAVQRIE